nr:RES family NAD+ phosphorylase [Limnobacter humi]
MKLVDNHDEQDVLEALLDSSKPQMPSGTQQLDYLLATPFRYYPKRGGSRFRSEFDPGVFYGAESVRTAAAELGHWRWKFLMESTGLERLEPVAHTAFRASVETQIIDLRNPPFSVDAQHWQHPWNYHSTQALARTAREAEVGGIIYRSVRDPQPAWCLALLTPTGFEKTPKPHLDMQTWYLAVTQTQVTWRRDMESIRFTPTEGP